MGDLAKLFSGKPDQEVDKRSARLMARGRCDGRRAKQNLRPPYLTLLDVDSADLPLADASYALRLAGVDHVGHTTWSHGAKPGHSYRVFADLLSPSWPALETATRQLFELIGLEPTRESWTTPAVFLPAVHPDRARAYRFASCLNGGSAWRPEPPDPEALARADPAMREALWGRPRREGASGEDLELLESALAAIPNAEYQTWIEVGMALRSGLPGEEGREAWERWSASQGYPDFTAEGCAEHWASFRDDAEGGVGLGTIFHRAREAGWRPPAPERKPAAEDFAKYVGASNRLPLAEALAKLDETYSFVWTGRGLVASDRGPGRVLELRSAEGFARYYATPRYRNRSLGRWWLDHHRGRRSYADVDFLPEGSEERLPAKTLNLWRGWAVPPAPEGTPPPERWLEHAREVVCAGEDDRYRWLLAWMAHLVRRPFELPGTAVVMRSTEGRGKGIFARALVDLAGPHGVHVTSQIGRFNSHLRARLVVFADEVTWGGRRLEEGPLKALVTEPTLTTEAKGVDAVSTRNFARLLIASNAEWVVPAARGARRWTVLDLSERPRPRRWYAAIAREMKAGGLAALHRHLLDLDPAELPDPGQIVVTEGLLDQVRESLPLVGRWLWDVAWDGQLEHDLPFREPGDFATTSQIVESCHRTIREHGERGWLPHEAALMRDFAAAFGKGVRRRQLGSRRDRRRGYQLVSREALRTSFATWIGRHPSELRWPD